MLLDFENKLVSFIKEHDLFSSTKKVVLAVSGGADSTALLYVMQALKTADILNVDNRIMYRIGVAARKLKLIDADFVMGIPLSVSGKNIYFDR